MTSANLDPRLFAESSSRDGRFHVKDLWHEMSNHAADDPILTVEFLHRQMHEEMGGLEIAARNLADFPDAPWELRLEMARQCWDEARHVEMFRRCYERRGGVVGAYPVLNFQYRIITRIPSLVGRLAVQNRSFEAAGIDGIHREVEAARGAGQDDLVELLETQLADELRHVRYANVWTRRLAEQGGPAVTFDIVRGVAQANEAFRVVAGDAVVTYEVAESLRQEAGFDPAEIAAAKELNTRR